MPNSQTDKQKDRQTIISMPKTKSLITNHRKNAKNG